MIRPLPPFTVRPLKRAIVRKLTPNAAILAEARSHQSSPVKASRRPVKGGSSRPGPGLKVLSREDAAG